VSYATGTNVSSDRSRAEIERILVRYGATSFINGWEPGRAAVGFVLRGRQYRLLLPIPDRGDDQFIYTPTGKERSQDAAYRVHDQEVRRRWRALALVLKAKLEAVQSGITTFEQEFAIHAVLPDGATVGEHVLPAIAEHYRTGTAPALLPPPRALTREAS
jgi:hypothetical protein